MISTTSIASQDSSELFSFSIPNWSFSEGQNTDPLFSHDHKNFIGILSKQKGVLAPSLFVFKKSRSELKVENKTFQQWIVSDLLSSSAKFIRIENINDLNNFKLLVYDINGGIVYIYVIINSSNIIMMSQDSTIESQHSDLWATLPDLAKVQF